MSMCNKPIKFVVNVSFNLSDMLFDYNKFDRFVEFNGEDGSSSMLYRVLKKLDQVLQVFT